MGVTPGEEAWLAAFEQRLGVEASGRYQRIEGKNEQELVMVLELEVARIRIPVSPSSAPQTAVTVICDEPDLELAHFLRQQIVEHDGLSVACPDFLVARTTSMERMRSWTKLVKGGRAFLFCWGAANDANLLEHIYALVEKTKPHAPREWYLAGPNVVHKHKKYANAITQPDEFHYEALNRFLQPLRGLSA